MPINNRLPLSIPSDHPCYPAHFPGNPLVPGALLLQWILRCLQSHYPHRQVSGLPTIKFLAAVKPGDNCELTVEESADTTKLKVQLLHNGNPVLKGVLSIAAAAV